MFTYNAHQYQLTSEFLFWSEAQTEALSLGGNLVTINDASEEAWLKETFGETEGFWIGLNDQDQEGHFEWISGESVSYTNWAPGEPNNIGGEQDYVWMNYGTEHKWDDRPSTRLLRGIIEINNTSVNQTNPGILALSQEEFSVNENGDEVIVTIIRTEGSNGTVSLAYATSNTTARAGEDYTAVSGTLSFGPGETSKTIRIPIAEDTLAEGQETLSIAIGNPEGAALGVPRTAIISIIDNDISQEASLTFTQEQFIFDENDRFCTVEIVRSGDLQSTVSVDLLIRGETAKLSSNGTSTSTLVFQAGEASKTVRLQILNDELPERPEMVQLTLSNPVGIKVAGQGTAALILNDDDPSPFQFREEILVSGLASNEETGSDPFVGPVAFDWTPNGQQMFIAERRGVIHLYDFATGRLANQLFLDISEQVNVWGQRGLLNIAVHPEFPQKPYIYFAYVYDSSENTPDGEGFRQSRLVRVTADASTNYTTVIQGSEEILLTTPASTMFHTVGGLGFGKDGSLFYAYGDGNQVHKIVDNPEVLQGIDSPFGKLYRIDPMTGQGYSDNPFYNGDASSIPSKVYSYGLRNPFRIAFHPITGEPFVGDVGWNLWEEINTGRGANFGWPYFEGGIGNSLLNPARARDLSEIPEIVNLERLTAPIYGLNHTYGGRSITLGDFYTGETYPEFYQNALFYSDFVNGNVDALLFNEAGTVRSATRFLDNQKGITQISTGPDGNLYFVNLRQGTVGRWVFAGSQDSEIETTARDIDLFDPLLHQHFELDRLGESGFIGELTLDSVELSGLPLMALYDEAYYLSQNPDVAAAISNGSLDNGYNHFVSYGQFEGRNPSRLYNETFYLNHNPSVAVAVAAGSIASGFQDYLTGGQQQGLSPSEIFDELNYRRTNTDVAEAIAQGLFRSGFEHYLKVGRYEGRNSLNLLYDENYYLTHNPDVAANVDSKVFTDGFEHYMRFGQREKRNPSLLFSEESYLIANPDVAEGINAGLLQSGFHHYVLFGRAEERTLVA